MDAETIIAPPKPSLLTLPPELHLHILLSLDSFPTVTALTYSLPTFSEIYNDPLSRDHIVDAILRRQIPNYDDALQLLEAQALPTTPAADVNPSLDYFGSGPFQRVQVNSDPHKVAEALLKNKETADKAARLYEETMLEKWGFKERAQEGGGTGHLQLHSARAGGLYRRPSGRLPQLTSTERDRFTHAFYAFWRLTLVPMHQFHADTSKMHTRELIRLTELAQWATSYVSSINDEAPNPLGLNTLLWWFRLEELQRCLRVHVQVRMGIDEEQAERGRFWPVVSRQLAPKGYWTVLDETQEFMGRFPEGGLEGRW